MTEPGGSEHKTCFVAMPVTTPASYAEDLRDTDHFKHVLAHLFTPALEQAGYEVIPPEALGAVLIHAEIIRHLEQADLVLADLSSHNANVFFELGIRTSLDRPVVLVTDSRTTPIPFDLGTINVLTYDESLAPWTLEAEVKRLARHVGSVPAGTGSGNAMWKYFGLTKRGGPAEAGSLEAKVDLLLAETAQLRLATAAPRQAVAARSLSRSQLDTFQRTLQGGLGLDRIEIDPGPDLGDVDVHVWGHVPQELDTRIHELGEQMGVEVNDVIEHPIFSPIPPASGLQGRDGPAPASPG